MLVTRSFSVSFVSETQKQVDISGSIADAREAIPALFDSGGQLVSYQITALDAATFQIDTGFAISGAYTLVVQGNAVESPPSPAPAAPNVTPPSLSTFWTYGEAKERIQVDLDLQEDEADEAFVKPNELIGYFNEGLKVAEAEILKIDEDYFLSPYKIPLVAGQSEYEYPQNIYAYKERGIVYSNGSIIYDVKKFRRKDKFTKIAVAEEYADSTADYRWYHTNRAAGAARFTIVPTPTETAILPPLENTFAPMTMWYIRRASRVPLIGQYVLNWDVVDQDTETEMDDSSIGVSSTFTTGDVVKVSSPSSLPGGLTAGTVYYVIYDEDESRIQFASTLALARAGTPITFTSTGTGAMNISIRATEAIVDATTIDIPEWIEFILQYVRCRVFEKDTDPRLEGAAKTLEALRQEMVETLTEIQQDDENHVERDMSLYWDLS